MNGLNEAFWNTDKNENTISPARRKLKNRLRFVLKPPTNRIIEIKEYSEIITSDYSYLYYNLFKLKCQYLLVICDKIFIEGSVIYGFVQTDS